MAYQLELILNNFTEQKFSKIETFIKTLHQKQRLFHLIQMKFIKYPHKKKPIFTVLKSPHVHKKSREQFQFKIFQRSIIFTNLNVTTLLYLHIFLIQYYDNSHTIKIKLSKI